jgi:hypothetical protein
MDLRPYGYACGNDHHQGRRTTGGDVAQWPGKGKDRTRNQRQQNGRVVQQPKIAVHFSLHHLVLMHISEKSPQKS